MTGQMAVMGREGDTKVIWDRTKPDEVEVARDTFDKLKKKGYMAYQVKDKDGKQGEVMQEFDAQAERVILVPQMVGG
jgi:predicted glycosyltransferase